MADISQNISKNIASLRKNAKLTQAELAEKLGYSDKAVSKWERGEGVPDIYTLKAIADLFGTTVDAIIKDHSGAKVPVKMTNHKKHFIITMLAVLCAWFVAVLAFVSLDIATEFAGKWLVFIAAVPVSLVILLVFNALWGKRRFKYLIMTALVWTFLLFIYLVFAKHHIGIIFIVGIPLQIGIVLWYALDRSLKKKRAFHGG